MKHFLTLGVGALLLAGCPGTSKDCESGDICDSGGGGGGGGGGTPFVQYLEYDCSDGNSCYWYVDSDGEMGAVEIDLLETGDSSWECGPDAKGEVVCGVWHEFHDAFSYYGVNDAYGGDTFSLALYIEDYYLDQEDNYSTLFDMGSAEIAGQTTALVNIYDSSGAWADCAVAGEYVEYYSGYCTNDFGGL